MAQSLSNKVDKIEARSWFALRLEGVDITKDKLVEKIRKVIKVTVSSAVECSSALHQWDWSVFSGMVGGLYAL